MKLKKYILLAFLSLTFMLPEVCRSQQNGIMTVEPLFAYPIAPESITDLRGKSNYLLEHFWDDMDFKSKKAVDQSALNDAFKVYSVPMQWADKDVAERSINKLIDSYKKNPTLVWQFMKAAEENLYGSRASLWIDDAYIPFIKAFLDTKKIPETRKLRYRRQLKQLENTRTGEPLPNFKYVTADGLERSFNTDGKFTLIEFGDPDCDDCRHAKLRMETEYRFTDLTDKEKINVFFIIPDAKEDWVTSLPSLSKGWTAGASEIVSEDFDIRKTPAFYVVNPDGTLRAKNVSLNEAMAIVITEYNKSQQK